MTATRVSASRVQRMVTGSGWCLVLIAACLLLLKVNGARVGLTEPPPWSQWGFVDFRDTIYLPTRDLLAGHNPYEAISYRQRHPYAQMFNLYLPQQFVLLGWMAYLPMTISAVIFCLTTVASLVWLVNRGLRDWMSPPLRQMVLPFLVLVLLVRGPGVMSVRQGQLAVLLAMLSWFVLTDTRSKWLQALAFSFVMIKPQTGLALLVLVLVMRGFPAFLRGVLSTFVLALPGTSLAAVNAGGLRPLVESWLENLEISSTDAAFFGGPVDLPSCMRAMGIGVSSLGQLAITAALATVVGLGIWFGLRGKDNRPRFLVSERQPLWFTCLALVMVLPNQRYALAVIVPPLLLSLGALFTRRSSWPINGVLILVGSYALLRSETVELALGLPISITSSMTGWLLLVCLLSLLPTLKTRSGEPRPREMSAS